MTAIERCGISAVGTTPRTGARTDAGTDARADSGAPTRQRQRSLRVLGAALALAGALAVVLAGCSSARNDLGTASGDCYVDLPAAAAAVHHEGSLLGVLLVSRSELRTLDEGSLSRAASARRLDVSQVCLVAFRGAFSATAVEGPVGRSAGKLAVVAVTYPGRRVVATLLVTRSPLSFGHGHIGL